MNLLITGSRTITAEHYELLKRKVQQYYPDAKAIWTGGAKGADQLGKKLASELELRYAEIVPNYERYGRHYAPLQRNEELVRLTDATLGMCDDLATGGTKHTLQESNRAGHPTIVTSTNGRQDRTANM